MIDPILTALREAGYFFCGHHSIIHLAWVLAVHLPGAPPCQALETWWQTSRRPWSLVPGLMALPVSVASQGVVLDHHLGMDHTQVLELPGAGAYYKRRPLGLAPNY